MSKSVRIKTTNHQPEQNINNIREHLPPIQANF